MKKIVVGKTRGIAEVIDEILNEPEKDIVLVVPKGSALAKSASNFRLLKREADSAGKAVALESVDDNVLALAKEVGLSSTHPLWQGVQGGISDIVAKKPQSGRAAAKSEPARSEEEEEEPTPDDDGKTDGEEEEEELAEDTTKDKEDEGELSDDDDEEMDDAGPAAWSAPRMSRKNVYIAIGVLAVVLLGGFYIVGAFFNRADVSISFKKIPWAFGADFTADKTVTTIDSAKNIIPAQVFSDDKNLTQTFPASSFSTVSEKARGTITIVNAFSAAPQDLVATTRFQAPDGKIFRLATNVTVPGEKNVNGALATSSIDASIVADVAGPASNVGPLPRLSIPGFAKTPGKSTGFYGVISSPLTGGFTGKKAVPTAADIANAKTKTTQALQSSLQGGFSGNYPNNFKILDGATTINVTKLTVNTSTDANGNFSMFGEATLQAIGFDEAALKTYLLSLAQRQQTNSVFNALTLNYSNVKANFTKGQIGFTLAAQGALEPAFSADDFKNQILGKSIANARSSIAALPNLSNGKISVWPFWLWSIPSSANKVHVTAD